MNSSTVHTPSTLRSQAAMMDAASTSYGRPPLGTEPPSRSASASSTSPCFSTPSSCTSRPMNAYRSARLIRMVDRSRHMLMYSLKASLPSCVSSDPSIARVTVAFCSSGMSTGRPRRSSTQSMSVSSIMACGCDTLRHRLNTRKVALHSVMRESGNSRRVSLLGKLRWLISPVTISGISQKRPPHPCLHRHSPELAHPNARPLHVSRRLRSATHCRSHLHSAGARSHTASFTSWYHPASHSHDPSSRIAPCSPQRGRAQSTPVHARRHRHSPVRESHTPCSSSTQLCGHELRRTLQSMRSQNRSQSQRPTPASHTPCPEQRLGHGSSSVPQSTAVQVGSHTHLPVR
mmetsp:Transcript_11113/g.35370  ORF Transcript_11113/g.35370 Transcript_11113/m.35370 type:complete len:346 (-) Transcript_11113:758-1795(-)